jgi:CubicO group peptidase (beta-lactamase class C family)
VAPPTDNAESFTVPPAGPSGGGGLYSTSDDYLRFAQMLLNDGEFAGLRYLSPRTVAMMRTNHLHADALKTMRPGTGWGMDFRVVMDAAAAGEPTSDGSYDWYGIAGTWFWIDPKEDLVFVGMIQHRGRANSEIQGVSRNLVYQALMN